MNLRRIDKSGWPTPMNVPPMKMRNTACVHCRKSFYFKDVNSLKSQNTPFVRHCGHVVCGKCAREYQVQTCPVCSDEARVDDEGRVRPVFVNIHVLGQICASQLLPVNANNVGDGDFTFRKTLSAKVQKEVCSECQDRATCKCFECGVSYCSGCFSKFHSFNKTRGHARMDLDTADTGLTKLPDQCGLHEQSNFEHWCTECNIHCCLKCVVEEHRLHKTVSLVQLNEEHREEFEAVYRELSTTLSAVYNSKKKLKNAQMSPEGLQARKIEDDIAQHFLFLHGILQNLEMHMMDTLKSQTVMYKNHLLDIEQKLQTMEEHLNDGILLCMRALSHSQSFNHAHVIEKIRGLLNVPCYLTDNPRHTDDSKMAFIYAEEIVETLKNHCQVVLDTAYTPFKLVYKAERPENTPDDDLNAELTRIPNIFKDPTPPPSPSISPLPERCPSSASSMPTSDAGQRRCQEVCITHITEEPFTFYARPTTTDADYVKMLHELTGYESDCEISEIPDRVRMYAIRKTPGVWFRGRIHDEIEDEDTHSKIYHVMDVDTGVELLVTLADIRMLRDEHAVAPALAQRYWLLDIYPLETKTPAECRAKMAEILKVAKERERVPTIYYVGDEEGVDILIPAGNDCDPISVRDALLFMGYGSFSSLASLLRSSRRVSNVFFHQTLRTHVYLDVHCLHVEAPNIIYVSLTSYDGPSLNIMLRKMSEMYDQTKKYKSLIYNPSVGMNVAAKCANSPWLRGTIIGIPDFEKIQVFLVDNGTTVILPYTKIRQLDPSYTAATTRAIKIQLKDISPVENVDMTTVGQFVHEFMRPYARVIVDSVQDNTHTASIVNRHEDSLAFALVLQGFAEPTTEEMSARLEKARKKKHRAQRKQLERALCAANSQQSAVEPWIPEKKPERKTDNPYEVEVSVEHVVSPDEIYVAMYQRAEYFDEIHRRMQTFYSHQRSGEPLDITINMLCTAFLTKNCAYYRVNIIAINDDSTARVFLIDQGRTETVPISALQSLAPELLEIPAYIFRVRLGGILPCGDSSTWPSASCTKLKEILLEYDRARIFMAKIDDDVDGVMTIELMLRKVVALQALEAAKVERFSVNRMLVDAGLALNIRNFARQNVLAVDIKREINFLTSSDDPVEETEETEENKETDDASDDTDSTDSFSVNDVPKFRFTPTDDMAQWLPPEPITQKIFTTTPFFIDWQSYVYLHAHDSNGPRVREMTKALNERFKNTEFDEEVDGAWQPGGMGTTKWGETGDWCRSYVHGVRKNYVAVEYIDYGTYMWERVEFMRRGVMFEDVPMQATKCKIHELAPNTHDGSWRKALLLTLHFLLVDKSCEVHVVAQNPEFTTVIFQKVQGIDVPLLHHLTNVLNADVRIVPGGIQDYLGNDDDLDSSNSDVADVVIERTCDNTNTADDDLHTVGTCSEIDDISECSQAFDETLSLEHDNLDTVAQAEIIEPLDHVIEDVENVENPDIVSAEENTLQDAFDAASETVYELPPVPAVVETFSEPVDVKNTENQVNKKINVEEKMGKQDICKKITPVKLACSALSTVDEVSEIMSQVTTDNEFHEAAKYLESNINDQFTSENSDPSTENTTQNSWKKKRWVPNHLAPNFIPQDLKLKQYHSLNIPNDLKTLTAVIGEVDPSASNHLWLHVIASEDDACLGLWQAGFMSVHRAMQMEAQEQPLLQDFTPDSPCCTKSTTDHMWHRAVVASAPPDCGTVELNYVDWGKNEWVLRDDIHCLKPKWLQVPMMAVKCRLWNISVKNNGPALRYLRQISDAGQKRFYVTVEDRDATGVLIVKLQNNRGGLLVNTEILKYGNSTEIKPDRKSKSDKRPQ